MQGVTPQMVRDWQDGLRVHGRTIGYTRPGETMSRPIKARVVFASADPLAGAVAAYRIRVIVDARDFEGAPPVKGDTATIDGARRGVMEVDPVHVGETFAGYRLGVAG